MPDDPEKEEDERKENADHHGTSDINGQLEADLAFKERAEKLLERLRSLNKPPAAEPGRDGEKSKGTDKHK